MAGNDELLGYTFHTIVAIIDSLVLRYEDWDGINFGADDIRTMLENNRDVAQTYRKAGDEKVLLS